jgi:ketosteroid isomerase-like protein
MVAVVALVSHVSPTTPVVSADTGWERQVREASAAWDQAFNSANLDQLMEHYADGAVSMPPGFPALVGKEAIRADFEWFFENFSSFHETRIVDILASGNLAVEQGEYFQTFTPKDGSDRFTETGKHIVIHRRSGRSWKVVKEIWNVTPSRAGDAPSGVESRRRQ